MVGKLSYSFCSCIFLLRWLLFFWWLFALFCFLLLGHDFALRLASQFLQLGFIKLCWVGRAWWFFYVFEEACCSRRDANVLRHHANHKETDDDFGVGELGYLCSDRCLEVNQTIGKYHSEQHAVYSWPLAEFVPDFAQLIINLLPKGVGLFEWSWFAFRLMFVCFTVSIFRWCVFAIYLFTRAHHCSGVIFGAECVIFFFLISAVDLVFILAHCSSRTLLTPAPLQTNLFLVRDGIWISLLLFFFVVIFLLRLVQQLVSSSSSLGFLDDGYLSWLVRVVLFYWELLLSLLGSIWWRFIVFKRGLFVAVVLWLREQDLTELFSSSIAVLLDD